MGEKDNFSIWGCTVCDTCDEVCPQKIELTEIFTVLKNMSIAAGEGPDYYTTQASTIYDSGKAIPSQPAIERLLYIGYSVTRHHKLFRGQGDAGGSLKAF